MFWSNVKKLLSEKNLLQKDLANILEINLPTLRNQISRNILPDAECAVKIAQVLNTTVESLVSVDYKDTETELSNFYKQKYENLKNAINLALKDN